MENVLSFHLSLPLLLFFLFIAEPVVTSLSTISSAFGFPDFEYIIWPKFRPIYVISWNLEQELELGTWNNAEREWIWNLDLGSWGTGRDGGTAAYRLDCRLNYMETEL